MPFGLCNVPSTFQAAVNGIFRPYFRQFILVFFYDILIYNPNWEDHLIHIRKTFEIQATQQFVVKPSNCLWANCGGLFGSPYYCRWPNRGGEQMPRAVPLLSL